MSCYITDMYNALIIQYHASNFNSQNMLACINSKKNKIKYL